MPEFNAQALYNGVYLLAPPVDAITPGDLMASDATGKLFFTPAYRSKISSTNKQGSTIQAGQVCAIHNSGIGFTYANATNDWYPAIGLAQSLMTDGAAGVVQTSGLFTLSDWTAITGTVELVARAQYWLDINSGMLVTSVSAFMSGNIVQPVGEAVSLDTMSIQIQRLMQL